MAKWNLYGVIALMLLGLPQLSEAQEHSHLKPFSTDGCSLFVDGPLNDPYRWRHCCLAHDLAYWQGGTQAERLAADETLRACMVQAQGSFTASYVFAGVRWGGHPDWPSTYRWGYGWSYWGRQGPRGYEPLSPAELAQLQAQLPQALALVAEDARQHPCAARPTPSAASPTSRASSPTPSVSSPTPSAAPEPFADQALAKGAAELKQKPQKQLQ